MTSDYGEGPWTWLRRFGSTTTRSRFLFSFTRLFFRIEETVSTGFCYVEHGTKKCVETYFVEKVVIKRVGTRRTPGSIQVTSNYSLFRLTTCVSTESVKRKGCCYHKNCLLRLDGPRREEDVITSHGVVRDGSPSNLCRLKVDIIRPFDRDGVGRSV